MDIGKIVDRGMAWWALILLVAFLGLTMWRCGDVQTGPDMVVRGEVGAGVAVGRGGAGEGVVGVGAIAGGAGVCDEVGLERSGVRWLVDGGRQLLLWVPMSPEIGEPYVKVWTPEVNERLLGRGPANEWFGVSLPGYGSWRIRLAAETIDHLGKVRQCDRHAFTVVARPPPPPPPEEEVCECHIVTDESGEVVSVATVCEGEDLFGTFPRRTVVREGRCGGSGGVVPFEAGAR